MNKQELLKKGILADKADREEKKQRENINENKKAGWKFVLLMLASLFAGFLVGGSSNAFVKNYKGVDLTSIVGGAVTRWVGAAAPFVLIVLTLFGFAYSSAVYVKCRKRWQESDGTDEELCDKLDARLSSALVVSNLVTIINYFLFSAAFYHFMYAKETVWFPIAIAFFLANIVLIMVHQQKVVDLVKLMNHEKKGSVYDTKFQDKWLESCDEAEKLQTYQCGFKAYKTVAGACVILWLFFTCIAMLFKITLWPAAISVLIWLINTCAYALEARKIR